MKIIWTIVLIVVTILAVASGIAKISLVPQEVEFFGRFGFSNPILIGFGAAQLIGGALMPFARTRFIGAAVVASTFLVSLVLLLMDGNLPMAIVTTFATLLVAAVMIRARRPAAPST